MKLAYADPPYPGNAELYKDHPDYAGEVDHADLYQVSDRQHRRDYSRLLSEHPTFEDAA